MKKLLKKSTAVLLAAIMMLSVMLVAPVTAGAATSGDFEYTVLDDGTAEITGYTGEETVLEIPSEIDGYMVTSIGYDAFYYCTSLTSVTISNSVASIGNGAFSNCTSLASITIPDSVTSIGEGAFEWCESLTNITISNNLTSIDSYVFYGCSSLTNITIPDSVTEIGYRAFSGCTSLENIFIPSSVTEIGYYAFENCASLKSIDVDNNNTVYKSVDGVLFDINMETLICYPQNKSDTSYDIPNSVTSVGMESFYDCDNLISVNIPGSVKVIESSAFAKCNNLVSVTIQYGLTTIEGSAFCDCNNLEEIDIPDSVTEICAWGDSDIFTGNRVFLGTKWYENQPDGVVYAGKVAYRYKGEMPENTKIVLKPDTVAIADNAFALQENLISIDIPNGVTTIGGSAFSSCKNLEDISLPDSVIKIRKNALVTGGFAFGGTGWEDKQPNGLVYIGDFLYTYKGENTDDTELVIKDGTKYIADGAFLFCDNHNNFTSITIPNSVISIGKGAFRCCENLKNVIIPASVTEIGELAFDGCEYLTISGYSGTAAETYANENGFEFIVLDENEYFTSGDFEYMILDDGTAKITGYSGNESTLYIPSEIDGYTVTVIGASAFENCDFIENVVIPESIVSIGNNAFNGCDNIERVFYDGDAEAWYNIEDGGGNDKLSYVKIYFNGTVNPDWFGEINWHIDNNGTLYISGSGVINPDEYSIEDDIPWYSQRESIKNIVIEDGITGIGNYSFIGCCNLETVSIPASVTYIGDFVFILDMNSVQSINVDENNEYYTSVDGVLFNKDMTEIIKYPNGRSGSYTIPDTVTKIHTCAFRECAELTGLEIPDSVTTIDRYAFFDCDSLLSVTIPASVTEIPLGCGLGYKFHKGYDEPIEGFTIKGYTGTAAETYATENGFTFIALDKQEPTEVVLTDKNTNISVVTDTDAELVVETLTSREDVEAVYAVLGDTNKLITVYDISLVKDGATIQPDGAVTVKIPASSENAKVYRIEADGTLTDMNAVFADGYLEFTTEHFSIYAVAEDKPVSTPDEPATPDEPIKIKGDVNSDGEYNIRDAAAIQLKIAQLYNGVFDASVADVNGDGEIGIKDAAYIQLDIAKLL